MADAPTKRKLPPLFTHAVRFNAQKPELLSPSGSESVLKFVRLAALIMCCALIFTAIYQNDYKFITMQSLTAIFVVFVIGFWLWRRALKSPVSAAVFSLVTTSFFSLFYFYFANMAQLGSRDYFYFEGFGPLFILGWLPVFILGAFVYYRYKAWKKYNSDLIEDGQPLSSRPRFSNAQNLTLFAAMLVYFTTFVFFEDTLSNKFIETFGKFSRYQVCAKYEYRGSRTIGHSYLFAKFGKACPEVALSDRNPRGLKRIADRLNNIGGR